LDKASTSPAGPEGQSEAAADSTWASIRSVLTSTDLVWRCSGCGYLRQQRVRPASCPDCGADSEEFVGRTSLEWRMAMAEALPPDTLA
jgi:rubrerythrin